MRKWIGIIIFSALLMGSASGTTLTVDDSGGADYTRIQDAVNAAINGDTIVVAAGIYNENVIVNKSVSLVGAGAEVTIVNASNPGEHVFNVTVNSVNISGFTMTGATANPKGGIYLAQVKNANILNNNASNNYHGIYLDASSNNALRNNTANGNVQGILIHLSNNNILTNNIANLNGYGIAINSSNNNTLTNNIANWNSNYGFSLSISSYDTSCINNSLTNNTANSNNYYGIYFHVAGSNTLTNNTANSNNYYGIYIHYSNGQTLTNNTASLNNYYGIYIDDTYPSLQHTLYNNIFNNTNNIYVYSSSSNVNTWNTTRQSGTNIIGGPYLGGNFWANPSGMGFSQTCIDGDKDGLCDSPYALNSNNIDYLPLAYHVGTITNSISYSALVATGQNTYVQSSNGSFGLLLKGQSKTINNSVILNNTGDTLARVEARFNDSTGGIYGLVSGANMLNATNFALGLSVSLVPLNNSGADVFVAVAPPGVTALDARLGVPSEAVAGDYQGTVVLTFSNNV